MNFKWWRFIPFVLAMGVSGTAFGAQPMPWEINFQPAATPVMERIHNFHNMLLIIEGLIVLLVLVLMVIIIVRFRASANPVPSKTTHNTPLEVIWTVVPILILVAIAVPSLRLLFYMDKIPKSGPEATNYPKMTLKITGHQWYWSYAYPDNGNFTFDSNIIPDEDLKPGQPRLLSVDNRVVLPINTNVRLLITSGDVIHDWAVPSFGVKTDAVPGRINETWIRIERTGTYYGQCSELCGINHGFMPIAVNAVTKKDFDAWVAKAKKEFASNDTAKPREVASNARAN